MWDCKDIEEVYDLFIELRLELNKYDNIPDAKVYVKGVIDSITTIGKFLERNGYDMEKINKELSSLTNLNDAKGTDISD